MKWTVHLEGGPKRVNHAAVLIGKKIYSFGGYCSTDAYKDWEPIPIHVLDTLTLRWSPVTYVTSDVNPFQRYGHTVVGYGHKVYMWGGRNSSVACATLLCFDTIELKWTAPKCSGDPPFAKDGHSACIINKKMYIFGGFEYATEEYSNEVHYLDFETMTWTKLNIFNSYGEPLFNEDYPLHRDFHTAVAYGDRMYVFGGRGRLVNIVDSYEEIYCPEIFYLDTTKKEWVVLHPKGDVPAGRRSHSAWIHNDNMYIFGGYNGNINQHNNSLYQYSIKNNVWTEIKMSGKKPCPRRRQACVLYNDKIYMFGGSSPNPKIQNNMLEQDDNPELLIDNSDLHILDFNPSLRELCKLYIVANKLDYSELPHHIIMDIKSISTPNQISRTTNQYG